MFSRSVHDDAAFDALIRWAPAVFLSLIVAGAWLLLLPAMHTAGEFVGMEALFTVTSAVCGVGLTTSSIATRYTALGQATLALFMQLGALAYMVVGAAIVLRLKARFLGGSGSGQVAKWPSGQVPEARPGAGGAVVDTGRRGARVMSKAAAVAMVEHADASPGAGGPTIGAVILGVVGFTLALELLGALLLIPLWVRIDEVGSEGLTPGRRLGLSLFHAISAFCNSGFTLQTDSFCHYQYGWRGLGVQAIIVPLTVLGGLGYVVLWELWCAARRKARLSGYSRLVLVTGAAVYLLSVVVIAAARLAPCTYQALQLGSEGTRPLLQPLDVRTVGAVLSDASFMSLSARGGGYRIRATQTPYAPPNILPPMDADPAELGTVVKRLFPEATDWGRADADTIRIGNAYYKMTMVDDDLPGEEVAYMTLMPIGGAPGGTAGGITTLAVAIIVIVAFAALRPPAPGSVPSPSLGKAQSPGTSGTRVLGIIFGEGAVRWALTVAAAFAALVVVGTLLLSFSEPYPIRKLGFEVVSAASGCGLSKDLCSALSGFGKAVLLVTMLLGRVGLLYLMGMMVMGPARSGVAGKAE